MSYTRLTRRNKDGTTWVKCAVCDIQDKCDYTKETCCQELQNRLAELEDKIEQGTLIEQKNCKNISEMHPVDGFTCSECGITIIDYVEEVFDEEDYSTTHYEYTFKYCPNCGAKIKD